MVSTVAKIPQKTLERKLLKNGYNAVLAVDEVGMGCLAGPVVVCVVSIAPGFYRSPKPAFAGVKDSKLLRQDQRDTYARLLKSHPDIQWKISACSPAVIDKINILEASRRAMRSAILNIQISLRESEKVILLIDGPHKIPDIKIDQIPIVKGDQKIFAIACASIIAKVHRDNLMIRYAKKYPGYGFEIHKGYGTKLHRQKIHEIGLVSIHRRSFSLR